MQCPFIELIAFGQLDDLAQVHHRDPVRHVSDDGKIMGDDEIGEVELSLESLQEVDNLRLD